MFKFLLVIQTLVAAGLVTVILMQRSEGGGLGVGGSSSGLMTARGAADFLTRATTVLATLFVVLAIVLAGLATVQRSDTTIDASLARTAPAPVQTAPAVPLANDDPLAAAAAQAGSQAPAGQAPAGEATGGVPLAPVTAPAGNGAAPQGR
ncbi:preprotein translocase subunit SecG [Allosphingosinicella humi]